MSARAPQCQCQADDDEHNPDGNGRHLLAAEFIGALAAETKLVG